MLLTIDRVGSPVLLTIHLPALDRSQFATVGCTIVLYFLVDRSFTAFQVRGFLRCQLPALDALSNAVLLVFLPFAYLAF